MALTDLTSCVPANSKPAWLLQSLAIGAAFWPKYGLIPQAMSDLHDAGLFLNGVGHIPLIIGGGLGVYYGLRGLELFRPETPKGIWAGDVFLPEKANWTSFLVTGRPGAGKTSGAIMPLVEQINSLYLGPDLIRGRNQDGKLGMVENPYARMGGLVLEVKGEFFEMIGYMLDQSQRNVFEDFMIIRPDSKIPVAKYFDEENQNYFYLNGQPCSSPADAGRLIVNAQANRDLNPEPGAPIRPDIFTCEDRELNAALPLMRKLTYPVDDPELCFLGWRREEGHLVRVSHTPEYNQPAFLLDAQGNKQTVPIPQNLKFIDRILVSNGLIYNLIDENVGPDAAAEKLTNMAAMAGRGEMKGGDSSYWTTSAQKLISSCIALHRAVHPETPATCGHVYQMVASDADLKNETALLTRHIRSLHHQEGQLTDPDKKLEMKTRVIQPLEVLAKYFAGEWVNLDDKLKGSIKTVVSNTFSSFVLDPALNETFCGKPTFSMADTLQKGRIFCLVPGQKYKSLAKIFGTGLNLDFMATTLARIDRSDYNKKRPLIRLADEAWNWAISGGTGGGDAHFLSLCRAARCINFLATQNHDQFIETMGRESTTNFLGQFGVFIWLQNFNKFTNDFAEELMEKGKREKFTANQSDKGAHIKQEWVESKLFVAEDFVKLASDEAVVFNGMLDKNMAEKTKLPKGQLTHDDELPKIARFMRRFLAGSIEQAVWRENRVNRFDPKEITSNVPKEPSAEPKPASAPEVVSPPQPPAGSEPKTKSEASPPPVQPEPKAATPENKESRPPPPPIGSSRKLNLRVITKRSEASESSPPASNSSPGHEGVTPREIDTESEAFKTMWSRLTLAAVEVAGEDEFGIQKMIREAGKKLRSGESTAPMFQVGPSGLSVGKSSLMEQASPIQTDSLDKLEPRENAPNQIRMNHARNKVFERTSGPQAEAGEQFFD